MVVNTLTLFGGASAPWSLDDWTDSDDRVRGGKSQSGLRVDGNLASFYGYLDIEALGGAGFASQRTTADDLAFDLSDYHGLQLEVIPADDKQWTLILKDELLPPADNGRERSTISWETSFRLDNRIDADQALLITLPWDDFVPTYRGKEQKDVEPLDLKSIKRVSFMVRSFFGSQQGSFCLRVKSVKAFKRVDKAHEEPAYRYKDEPRFAAQGEAADEKAAWMQPRTARKAHSCFCLF